MARPEVLSSECSELVRSALADADAVTPAPPGEPVGTITDLAAAERALSAAWSAVVAATKAASPPSETAARLDALERIRQAEHAVTAQRLRRRDSSFGRLAEALTLLREDTATEGLIRSAGDAVVHLGFDRAIVSAVRQRYWVPEWVSDERDPDWSEEILHVGRTDPRVLDSRLVESQVMARQSAVIVHDAQSETRVHDRLVRIARTNAYIAVPIVINGSVTGFLHADNYYHRRDLDELGTTLLRVVAETFVQVMQRNMAAAHAAETRSELARLSRSLPDFGDPASPVLRARTWTPAEQPPRDPSATAFPALSRREFEVMRLVALGQTNAAIGRRLVISEGTVKSHVNNILRKLDASSRAEVVTRWITAQR